MDGFSAESLATALAIIGVVIIISALLSGLVDRSGLPQVAVFLALGAALGPFGLGVLELSLHSPSLRVVSVLSISIDELQRLWRAQEPVTILDVRTDRSIEGSNSQVKAAVRMPPDHVAERAKELGLKPQEWLVAYCA
jgi:hypothetical protein